jgi:hypothetical protein
MPEEAAVGLNHTSFCIQRPVINSLRAINKLLLL